jgi:hypothetical protein
LRESRGPNLAARRRLDLGDHLIGHGFDVGFGQRLVFRLQRHRDGDRLLAASGNLATYRETAPTTPQTTTFVYGQKGLLTQIKYPSFPATPFMTNV